jgi:vancomycin resistance protein YoaR
MFKGLKNSVLRWLSVGGAIFFTVLIFLVAAAATFYKVYEGKIYPGVWVGPLPVGGLTEKTAQNLINQRLNELNRNGITFFYANREAVLYPVVSSVESDLAYQIISFDAAQAVSQAYRYGRGNSWLTNLKQIIYALYNNQRFLLDFSLNKKEIKEFFRSNFSSLTVPAQDARLTYRTNFYGQPIAFAVVEEKFGQAIDYIASLKRLEKNLSRLDFSPIQLTAKIDHPKIYARDCIGVTKEAEKFIARAPLVLKYKDKTWKIEAPQVAGWLVLKLAFSSMPDKIRKDRRFQKKKVVVGLNEDRVKNYLSQEIAAEIDQKPLDAKLSVVNGRVVEFQTAHDGLALNLNKSFRRLENNLKEATSSWVKIELAVETVPSQLKIGDVNDLGIKEIIGIGQSSFAGSPKNRRHNIRIGANILNGILIKPKEEFSLLKALGEIDGKAGYLPELVIKENKTIPEYGGGLCQIGTTMFRAALDSGLPITMRRNHSYRVSYYEPAGTDATIYDPWPDLKFINNTPAYILIQSRIKGDNLYFDFWGTSDGRTATRTYPVIYNITKPGPTKYIETLNLPPGEKKCTEHAHNGADAYFDYVVTYPDGEVKEERFYSHYVPWRAVCLIGVKELTEDKAEKNGENDSRQATTSVPALE